jgi:flagellar motility protein MotE (MotC chaperone)
MRAVELPSPAELKRRLSPLPLTLAALTGLLVVELAALAPSDGTADVVAATTPLAAVAPAAAPSAPTSGAATGEAAPADPAAPQPAEATTTSPRAPAPARIPVDLAEAERRTARVIDELLAPAAGGAPETMAVAAEEPDPLAAEPFLQERRALARQREALSVRQLAVEVAEERLTKLVAELSALKDEIDTRLAELEAGDEQRLARLVTLYEKMRPKDAARIFDDLDFDVLVPLALAMNERKLAPIVAAMTPEVARKLTGEVAEERADASLAEATRAAP